MKYEVIRINEETWRIEDGNVRFFLLTGTERALLVDSGKYVDNAREIAESLTKLPVKLINTHADMDHTACNAQFETVMMNPAEYPFYRKIHKQKTALEPVWDGDKLELGGRELEIITVPGHTAGSIAILDDKYRVLIGGDGIQNGRIYMFGKNRDLLAYLHSLQKLRRYEERFDTVYPSHADFPMPKSQISRLADGAERILRGEIPALETEFMGTPIWEYRIEGAVILYDHDIEMPF